MSNLRYIRYSRKSSEPKEKQALSIPEQNAECEKYAVTNNLNITYRLEESKSSFKPRIRPVFDQMLRLIENGAADAILAWAPNRLCRNPEEGGRILQLLQDGVLKEIRTTTGEAYTPESDHLVLQIHFGMANQYSRNISRDVRRSLIHKRERGEYPRMAPVGFDTFGEKGSRNLKPNILEAPLIRKVYEMAATGQMSLHYLSNWLFDSGLRTKKGKRISVSHLYRILTSPIYYGCFYSLGELYSGSYEPIVSKNLFDQVQVALGIRSKPRMNTWKYWTNGLVYCAECGCAITTTIKTKHYKETDRTATYLYNHCTHRKGGCHEHPIGADDFQQLLKDDVTRISIDEEVWRLGVELLKTKHQNQVNQNLTARAALQAKIRGCEERIAGLITMRAGGELTKEEFLTQKNAIIAEKAGLEEREGDNKATGSDWLERVENYLNTAFYAKETMEGKDEVKKRKLITDVGENLLLKDRKLVFTFRKPYDVLLQPAYCSDWYRLVDAFSNKEVDLSSNVWVVSAKILK